MRLMSHGKPPCLQPILKQSLTNKSGTSGTCEAEIPDNAGSGVGLVQSVKMDAWDAGAQEFVTLPGGVVDAELGDGLVVFAQFFEPGQKGLGEARAAHGGEALDLGGAHDGDDAGTNGDGGSQFFGEVLPELEEVGIIKEELGQNEFRAVIDLLF